MFPDDENKRLQSVSPGAAAGDVQPDRGSGQSRRSAAGEEPQHHTERRSEDRKSLCSLRLFKRDLL